MELLAKGLHSTLDACEGYAAASGSAAGLSPQDILSYAHRLRWTTFAPLLAGGPTEPPAPQQWHMQVRRATRRYYQCADCSATKILANAAIQVTRACCGRLHA